MIPVFWLMHSCDHCQRRVSSRYLFPLVEKLLDRNDAVGVDDLGLDAVALGNLLHLVVDSQNGLPL